MTRRRWGVISLALVAHGTLDPNNFTVPVWVKLAAALAIALGTYAGGWRIIRRPPRGHATQRGHSRQRQRGARGRACPALGRGADARLMLATIVNFDALWKIAAVGFGVGAGAVAVWSVLLIAVSHVTAARDRDDTIAVVGYGTLIAGCGLLFAATLVLGFIAMTHK